MNPAALLLRCRVMHDRLRPAHNRFVYSVFCLRVDIDTLPALQRWWFGVDRKRLISLYTRDHGARDGTSLSQWIRPRLAALGLPDDGTIWLQTTPRIFGYVFNPVSFWYCYDRTGALRALVAEVNNTFGEHHAYLVTAPDLGAIQSATVLATRKRLHVSPFNDVQGYYAFQVRETEGAAYVGIDYYDDQGLVLRTSIGGRKASLTLNRMLSVLACQPWAAIAVIVRIHWQALRLWRMSVPFHGKHPPSVPPVR
ncbi:DUF1365 domain-containing protein [Cupriavidus numazuensis]|uniref:DUF1365 domain-containing protein n=1 Tax=Cupriavidus numazuensis TaxID=221992 RepID=A0ABN7QBL7_9BURK|nr:DUF1365 domain-containing protein [Cupriavidus numazuensis]CAG2160996.1 hypothetical protein LMG26411_07921 [Cupriavidus numazuensis]